MTWLKWLTMMILTTLLTGCGHGFEGEYQSEAGSSIELMDAFADVAGSQTIVIGTNYIDDNDGNRTEYEQIFVRESGSNRYLVFKASVIEEDVWKIIDDNTLMKGNDLMNIKLVRVKK